MLEYAARGPAERYETVEDARRIVHEMLAFPLPIVAAVNGPAVGLGCSLAMFCDVVLMSEFAYFAHPHVTVGLVAADGGVLTWPVMMSLLWAKEYILTGDRIDATNAFRMGLANHVLPPRRAASSRKRTRRSFSVSTPTSVGGDKARFEHSPSSVRHERA